MHKYMYTRMVIPKAKVSIYAYKYINQKHMYIHAHI